MTTYKNIRYNTPLGNASSEILLEEQTASSDSTVTFTNGFANEEIEHDSGDILYTESRRPISRASDQTEDIKLIIEF